MHQSSSFSHTRNSTNITGGGTAPSFLAKWTPLLTLRPSSAPHPLYIHILTASLFHFSLFYFCRCEHKLRKILGKSCLKSACISREWVVFEEFGLLRQVLHVDADQIVTPFSSTSRSLSCWLCWRLAPGLLLGWLLGGWRLEETGWYCRGWLVWGGVEQNDGQSGGPLFGSLCRCPGTRLLLLRRLRRPPLGTVRRYCCWWSRCGWLRCGSWKYIHRDEKNY